MVGKFNGGFVRLGVKQYSGIGVGALVLLVSATFALSYFDVINIPFLPFKHSSTQVEGDNPPPKDLTKAEYEAQAPPQTQDNIDENAANTALDDGSLALYIENYDKIISRHAGDKDKAVFYYAQRSAYLVVTDAALYKDQVVADANKIAEISPDSPASAQLLVDLYTELEDRKEALRWRGVAESKAKMRGDQGRE